MMINNVDHTVSSRPSLSNCRQSAGYFSKSNTILAHRRRTELRRLKVLSNANGSFSNKRRFENTKKEHNDDFSCHSSVIGRRREMEDAVTIAKEFVYENSRKFDFYGVYDGHGGSHVAYACRERLHKLLVAEMDIENENTVEMNWENLMVESFAKMDEEVSATDLVDSMGSTAVVAVVGDKEIVVANCGDSRAVLSRGGAIVALSIDFMILASDGLWDVISNDLACQVVRKCIDGWTSRRRSLKAHHMRSTNNAGCCWG